MRVTEQDGTQKDSVGSREVPAWCRWAVAMVTGSAPAQASARVLPVVLDGLPQLAEHPPSVPEQRGGYISYGMVWYGIGKG